MPSIAAGPARSLWSPTHTEPCTAFPHKRFHQLTDRRTPFCPPAMTQLTVFPLILTFVYAGLSAFLIFGVAVPILVKVLLDRLTPVILAALSPSRLNARLAPSTVMASTVTLRTAGFTIGPKPGPV